MQKQLQNNKPDALSAEEQVEAQLATFAKLPAADRRLLVWAFQQMVYRPNTVLGYYVRQFVGFAARSQSRAALDRHLGHLRLLYDGEPRERQEQAG
jgi:hypothetical protein